MKVNEAILIVVRKLRNAFEMCVEHGDFVIKDGVIGLTESYLNNGWIAITGSKLNNGIFKLKIDGTQCKLINGTDEEIPVSDESFTGSVWQLAFPKDFISLCDDILTWFDSPAGKPTTVVSESVVGFYTKTNATNKDGSPIGWEQVFATRLNSSWRKMWESELIKSL